MPSPIRNESSLLPRRPYRFQTQGKVIEIQEQAPVVELEMEMEMEQALEVPVLGASLSLFFYVLSHRPFPEKRQPRGRLHNPAGIRCFLGRRCLLYPPGWVLPLATLLPAEQTILGTGSLSGFV